MTVVLHGVESGRHRKGQAPDGADRVAPADVVDGVRGTRHFLFLRGPFGSFFAQIAEELGKAGFAVSKIVFDGGDLSDWGYSRSHVAYRDGEAEWRDWISRFMSERGVTDLVVFNDCIEVHQTAILAAKAGGLRVHVFEEGYFRPRWITLEADGVNAYSPCPRDPEFYRTHGEPLNRAAVGDADVGRPMTWLIFRAIGHYVNKVLLAPVYPRGRNPFALPVFDQIVGSVLRYAKNRIDKTATDRRAARLLASPDPFFLALMQRAGDSQLWKHSNYTNESFAAEVTESFSQKAPADARLVFKLHPLDPGMVDYEGMVRRLAAEHGVADRVVFLDGGNLNLLARRAKGAVTINSTAGLATIGFGCPTKVLGRAVYDIEGLTDRKPLDRFWNNPQAPDHDLFLRFRHVVMERTQINGAFYSPKGQRLAASTSAQRLRAAL